MKNKSINSVTITLGIAFIYTLTLAMSASSISHSTVPSDCSEAQSIEPLAGGEIFGYVRDANTHAGIYWAWFYVHMKNQTVSVPTGQDGVISISHLDPGFWPVQAQKTGYKDEWENVSVIANERTYVYIYLSPLPAEFPAYVYGTVKNSKTGNPINAVHIYYNNKEYSTNSDGEYSIQVTPGTVSLTYMASGYQSTTIHFNVDSGENMLKNVNLAPTSSSSTSSSDSGAVVCLVIGVVIIIVIVILVKATFIHTGRRYQQSGYVASPYYSDKSQNTWNDRDYNTSRRTQETNKTTYSSEGNEIPIAKESVNVLEVAHYCSDCKTRMPRDIYTCPVCGKVQ